MSFEQMELLDKSPLGIVVCDKDERIVWCNKLFLRQTHLSESDVIDQLYPSLPLEAIDKDAQVMQLFQDDSGEETKFQYWTQSLDSPKGFEAHYFAKEREPQGKLNLAVAKLGATKIPKRASWVEFLDYEVSRSRRYENPLSILKLHLVVIDKPEKVAQETLNQTIKDTLTNELRWADMIGHTDHGSYLMVLPETPFDSLIILEEKLDSALKYQIEFIGKEIQYKLVFGRAQWQKNDDSQSLLKRARENLVEKLESLLAVDKSTD